MQTKSSCNLSSVIPSPDTNHQIQAPSLCPGGGRERAGGESGGKPTNSKHHKTPMSD
jgi:hypothetical protein